MYQNGQTSKNSQIQAIRQKSVISRLEHEKVSFLRPFAITLNFRYFSVFMYTQCPVMLRPDLKKKRKSVSIVLSLNLSMYLYQCQSFDLGRLMDFFGRFFIFCDQIVLIPTCNQFKVRFRTSGAIKTKTFLIWTKCMPVVLTSIWNY